MQKGLIGTEFRLCWERVGARSRNSGQTMPFSNLTSVEQSQSQPPILKGAYDAMCGTPRDFAQGTRRLDGTKIYVFMKLLVCLVRKNFVLCVRCLPRVPSHERMSHGNEGVELWRMKILPSFWGHWLSKDFAPSILCLCFSSLHAH